MHRIRLGLSLPVSMLLVACAQDAPRVPTVEEDRTSYAIGLHLGMRLRQMEAPVDPERVVEGFAAGLDERGDADAGAVPPPVKADELRMEIARLDRDTRASVNAARAAVAERNLAASMTFLAANRTRPGVVELPSGVQYRVLTAGTEPPPSIEDRVTIEYEGRLLDGAVFDTSRDRSAPTIVKLRRTPDAWREVAPRVAGGSTVEIWVPGALTAVEHPIGLIPPAELVVFTIRLVAIDRHLKPVAARAPP